MNYNETIMPFQEQKNESKKCSNPASTLPDMEPYGLEVADVKTEDLSLGMLLGGPKDIEYVLGETRFDIFYGVPDAVKLGGDVVGVS